MKNGSWFKELKLCESGEEGECVKDYNRELDAIVPISRWTVKVLVGASLMLNLLCFKYRWLADFIYELEAII